MKDAGVILCECRALCGNGIGEACLMAANDINLSLANNSFAFFCDFAPCPVECVKHMAFSEYGGFGAIHIFGDLRILDHRATAESYDAALLVADREHNTPPETVIIASC